MHCRIKTTSLIIMLIIVFITFSKGQEYSYESFRQGDYGIPDQTIATFNQDKHGYFWFTTGEGIYRYDGKHSEFFPVKAENTFFIDALWMINDTTFYLVSGDHGLKKFIFHNKHNYYSADVLTDVFEAKEYLYKTHKYGNNILVHTSDKIMLASLEGKLIKVIAKTSRENKFGRGVMGNNEFLVTDDNHKIYKIKNRNIDTLSVPLKYNISYLLFYNGNYWFMDRTRNRLEMFTVNKKFKVEKSIKLPKLNYFYVKILFITDDLFVLTTRSHGIILTKNSTTYHIINKNNGLPSNAIINCTYLNPTLVVLSQSGITYIKNPLVQNFTERSGLFDEFVWQIESFKNRKYVLTTSGIDILTKINDLKFNIKPFKIPMQGTPIGLYNQNDDYLWILTNYPNGLLRYDGKKIKKFNSIFPKTSEPFLFIHQDAIGNSWIWGGNETYFFKNFKFTKIVLPDTAVNKSVKIIDLQFLPDSSVIMSTTNDHIYKYIVRENKFEKIGHFQNLRKFYYINKDSLIIAYRNGRVELKTESATFDYTNRVCGNTLYNIDYLEKYDKYILTSEAGVHIWDIKNDSVLHINSLNGLTYNETNAPGLYFDDEGIWVGTSRGLNHIPVNYLEKIKPYKIGYHIEYLLGNKIYDVLPDSHMYLPYDLNNFKFKFVPHILYNSGFFYSSYKLFPFEKNLNQTQDNFIFNYPNLSYGEYEFTFNTYWQFPLFSLPTQTIKFTVLKPFYLTYWFLTLLFFILFIIVYGIIYYRSLSLRRSNLKLQELINRQTENLETYKSILESVLKNIKDPIIVFGREGDFILSNQPAENLNLTEMYKIIANLPENYQNKLNGIIKSKSEKPVFSENPITIKNDKYIFYFTPLMVEEQLKGYSFMLVNVTNLLENEQLKAKFEAVQQTFATFSHYINNYLQVIFLHLDLYRLHSKAFNIENSMRDIHSSVKKINELLSNFEESISSNKLKTTEYAGVKNAIFDLTLGKNSEEPH